MKKYLKAYIGSTLLFGFCSVVLATELINPIGETSITGFLGKILDIILVFATPVIIFFIIYGGFMFVTAQGDTTKIAAARSTLTWAVVGAVIVLGARAISLVIETTVNTL